MKAGKGRPLRRYGSWAFSVLFLAAVGLWGYITVQETVPEGLRLGAPAPDFLLSDLEGNPVTLSQFRGTPVVLRFSSRTCSFCYDDFGFLQALQEEYQGRIQVIAVELGAPPEMVRAAVRGRNEGYPVVVDVAGELAEKYRLSSIPQTYFIRADGRLSSRVQGELEEVRFQPHLAALLNPDGAPFESLEDELRAIAREVRCQECQGLSVWDSHAASAWEMRQEILSLLEAGLNRQQVLDTLVERYGVWILMRPPARGAFLWVYLTPFLFVAVGCLVMRRVLRQRRRQEEEPRSSEEPLDPELEAKVRERLKDYL